MFTLAFYVRVVWQRTQILFVMSLFEMFPASNDAPDGMPFREMCPRICQLPSNQAARATNYFPHFLLQPVWLFAS